MNADRRIWALAVLPLLALLAGCGKEDLRCYVGGTMRPAIEELAQVFEKETGKHIDIDYADSGGLLIKIDQSRKGDLYVCHDPFAGALELKRLHRRIWTVAALMPSIAVAKGNPKKIQGLRDLGREGLRIGLTDPNYSTLGHICPVMFKKTGVADAIAGNVVTRSRMGGQIANAVIIGNLDAGIVWNAVIHARKEKLDLVPIEPPYRPDPKVDAVTSATFGQIDMSMVKVTIATLACSKRLEDATAFAELVNSRRGRAVFAKHGFTDSPVPPPPDDPTPAPQPNTKATEATGPVYLYCCPGIRLAAAEVIDAFTAETGISITPDYAGSGVLLSRIKASRQGDLYAPGDERYLDRAAELNLIGKRWSICYFVPVIMVKKGNPKGIQTLADLTKPGLRLALGNPDACAVGKATVQIFEKNKIAVEDYRKNLVFPSLTVNELGVQVKTGHCDAAIVWDAIAAQYADSTDVVAIPKEQNIISHVTIALLKSATQAKAAERFAAFLCSEKSQAILQEHHYTTQLAAE
ncbi:MAG: molybdate ABC transporter substrate-binding protein [Candidatus Brocadiae bacterium]|nr:molybdate ABC transporter substrate-binding protein [Candidatus Brocadiia bacterium]